MDQTKKTMRHFYCRDVLWETFEGMASDFDCSIDYLINEAMRIYARSKNYTIAAGGHSQIVPSSNMQESARTPMSTPSVGLRGMPGLSQRSPGAVRPPPPPVPLTTPRPTPPPIPGSGNWTPPLSSPPLSSPQLPAANEPQAPPLYLIFNGQRVTVDKDQFVIGRGSKTADLAIKDGNISRKHALVLRRNGVYYIKDLGSTNGIDYKGMRIDNKRIDEGDTFFICDYELKFTYED